MGQNTLVNEKEVIGIFDLDNTTVQKATREFLNKSEAENEVFNIATDIPRSFIVCKKGENKKLYLSQLSPTTLTKRAYYAENYNYESDEHFK